MAIEKKTGLFYELMIRGSHDPLVAPLGQIMTYQLQTGTALVDTDSNTLAAPYAPDPAKDLTKEQAVAFLGDQMAGFLDQLTAANKRGDDVTAAKADVERQLADAKTQLEAAHGKISAMEAAAAEAEQKLAELDAVKVRLAGLANAVTVAAAQAQS